MKERNITDDDKTMMAEHLKDDLEPIQLFALQNGIDPNKGAIILTDMVIEECPFCCQKNGIVRTHEDADLPKCWNCMKQVERCDECNQLVLDYEMGDSGWCVHCEREGEELAATETEVRYNLPAGTVKRGGE